MSRRSHPPFLLTRALLAGSALLVATASAQAGDPAGDRRVEQPEPPGF